MGRIKIDANGVTIIHSDKRVSPVECIYPHFQVAGTKMHLVIPPFVDAQITWHWQY